MKNKILIITNSYDLHVDCLVPILEQKSSPAFRLNLDKFPCDYQVNQRFLNGTSIMSIRHLPTGESIDLNELGAIWSRKPAEFSFMSGQELSSQERAYSKSETEHALFGIFYALDCYWMSHPLALRGAAWKGEQLKRAQNYGFKIPATLTTNNPDDVIRFYHNISGDMVFKSLSGPDLASAEVSAEEAVAGGLITTMITDDMLEDIESVRELPCHFQEYIPKKYELRVTIVGDRVFAAKIHSQDDERTAIDSRDMSAEILYEATTLHSNIEERCLALMKSYDLNYSAMDIIVTPEDEYVFLENNPNGQFLYIEQLIPEFNILETVADTLISQVRSADDQLLKSAAN